MKPRTPFELLTWWSLIVAALAFLAAMLADAAWDLIAEDYRR